MDKSDITNWREKGVKVQPGTSLEMITTLESQLQFQFPNDFKEFYQQANGCEYYEMTENLISLWSLERILEEYQKSPNKNYVGFCDYLINSYSFGFFKNVSGVFQEFNQFETKGETFKEFLETVVSSSDLPY